MALKCLKYGALVHKLILESVLKLKNVIFLHFKPFKTVKQNILSKPISVSGSSMSVSSNSIVRFLNFALKITKPTDICDEGDGLVAVLISQLAATHNGTDKELTILESPL